jgi:hypothetical protein
MSGGDHRWLTREKRPACDTRHDDNDDGGGVTAYGKGKV